MMDYMLELGIFDDGDREPTVMLSIFEATNDPAQLIDLCVELRSVAEAGYGRPAPDHALFWFCSPRPS